MDKKKQIKQSLATAYHEAGHAVMHLQLGLPLRRASIIPNKQKGSLGHVHGGSISTWMVSLAEIDDAWEYPRIISRALREICASKAGHIAERRATKKTNHEGAEGDRSGASIWLFLLAPELATQECIALDRWLELRTTRLVKNHWSAIKLVAEALLTRRSLTGAEVRQIVASRDPLARAKVRYSKSQLREQAVLFFAELIRGMSPASVKAHIENLSPGERRLWQKARRVAANS